MTSRLNSMSQSFYGYMEQKCGIAKRIWRETEVPKPLQHMT